MGEEALAIGLYAAMTASTFEECIELAANHDGDSDSTATIAGQLWGARHGVAALPSDAVDRLDVREPLLAVFREWRSGRSTLKISHAAVEQPCVGRIESHIRRDEHHRPIPPPRQ